MASTIAAVTTSGGGVVTTADASGNLNLLAGTTTVVALTTAGAAVTGTLSVSGATIAASSAVMTVGDATRTASSSITTGAIVCGGGLGVWSNINLGGAVITAAGAVNIPAYTTTGDTDTGLWFPAANTVAASTAGVERLRIDSSGLFFVNQTAQAGNTIQRMGLTFASNVEWGLNITSSSTATGNAVNFTNSSGTQIGQIQTSTTATAYVTSSDYRLKEDIAPMTGALAKIAALKPVTYKWKSTGETTQGFIAHELQEIIPECATGTKDGTHEEEYEVTPAVPAVLDAEGVETTPAVQAVKGTRTVPSYQGVDTSFLVATLTAAIQELKAIIDTQATRIAALEAK